MKGCLHSLYIGLEHISVVPERVAYKGSMIGSSLCRAVYLNKYAIILGDDVINLPQSYVTRTLLMEPDYVYQRSSKQLHDTIAVRQS